MPGKQNRFNANAFTETGKARLHCDAHKEHKEISISPLDPNCGSHFTYDHMGRISAEPTDADALKTIAVLNLKERALTKDRENAIDAYLWDVSTSDFVSDEELKMTRTFLEQKDANGRYEPFYFVIFDVIDQFLGNKI